MASILSTSSQARSSFPSDLLRVHEMENKNSDSVFWHSRFQMLTLDSLLWALPRTRRSQCSENQRFTRFSKKSDEAEPHLSASPSENAGRRWRSGYNPPTRSGSSFAGREPDLLVLAATFKADSRSLNPMRRRFPLGETIAGILITHFPVDFMRCGMNLVGFDIAPIFAKSAGS